MIIDIYFEIYQCNKYKNPIIGVASAGCASEAILTFSLSPLHHDFTANFQFLPLTFK